MALKGAFTFLEMVARLTRGYTKATGKQPDNLAKLKINMEAAERIKQQNVVTEFPKDRITPFNEPRPEKGEVTPIKKFLLNKKTIRKAVDDIFPTGDYKYDAEMAAEALVENNPKFFKTFKKIREKLLNFQKTE